MSNSGVSEFKSSYTQQFVNPSLPSTRLPTTRGIARVSRGEISRAESGLEEAIGRWEETIVVYIVATALRQFNKGEGDDWWRYVPLTPVQTHAKANPYSIVN